jgi:hypothetical protein
MSHNHYIQRRGRSLIRAIRASLYDTIRAHGPIVTESNVSSACKRIFGALKAHHRNYTKNTGCSSNEWLEIYKENWAEMVDDEGMVTIPWADVRSIINKAMERGIVIESLEQDSEEIEETAKA